MRVVAQRVDEARVEVAGKTVGSIGRGILVLVGFVPDDDGSDLDWVAGKLCRLRIFPDCQGVMNCSVKDVNGEILAVSQFTLYASTRKGNRPSWSRAAPGDVSEPLFRQFVDRLERELGKPVASGIFGADMQVKLNNNGPVTIVMDSKDPE